MTRLHHEQIYRGSELMQKLAVTPITICGAGAIGSNLAMNLARMGVNKLTLIDRDRVEERNIGTQVYSVSDVGGRKAEILRNTLYRELGTDCKAVVQDLSDTNLTKLLKGAEIIVDAFDNSVSRKALFEFSQKQSTPCLHAGVNNEYGEAVWNEDYRVPSDEGEDICDYPLALNIIMFVVTIASESLIRFLQSAEKQSYSFTLKDLSINLSSGASRLDHV